MTRFEKAQKIVLGIEDRYGSGLVEDAFGALLEIIKEQDEVIQNLVLQNLAEDFEEFLPGEVLEFIGEEDAKTR